MVFTFLKARGLSVGSSLVEDDKLDLVRARISYVSKTLSLFPGCSF